MSKHIDYEEEAKYRMWWLNNTGGLASDGLTVRDYFAAKAMQSMAKLYGDYEHRANEAYRMADAMMKERAK